MSTGIKLDIQMFWTEGVNKNEIDSIFNDFKKVMDEAKEKIENTRNVKKALQAGWKGADCDTFIEKFEANAKEVCNEIDSYKTAVSAEFDRIVGDWADFQSQHIS